VFAGEDEEAKAEARACAAHVLDETYKLLHPMMPFMTEELWAHTGGEAGRDSVLALTRWPAPDFEDADAAADINWLVDLVSGIRSVRAEMNVPPSATAPLVAVGADEATRARIARHDPAIRRLARVGELGFAGEAPKGSAQIVLGDTSFCLPLGDLFDLSAEESLRRVGRRREAQDRFERETLEFFERVRDAYLMRARREPGRYCVIDASQPVEQVEAQWKRALKPLLP